MSTAQRNIRRVALTLTVAVAVGLMPGAQALAQPDECPDIWADLASWSLGVERQGVDTQVLEELSEISMALERCFPAGPGSHDGMGADVEVWRSLVAVYFQTEDIDRVMCLMALESGGNPNARNPRSGAAGLMQVMPSWAEVFGYEVADLFDPSVNLWIAAELADAHGWSSWSPYLRGACR